MRYFLLMKKSPSKKPPSVLILLLSFILPGAGQLMQKRWVAGSIFLIIFLAGFAWLMTLAIGNMVDYYRLGFEFETYEPNPTTAMALLPPLAMAVGVYLANLLDVFAAQHRRTSAEREAAFIAEWEEKDPTCDPYRR